jgi:hypothetical protein
MSSQEWTPTPDLIGKTPNRDREHEIDQSGAHEQQREVLRVQMGPTLERQVDERVADRDDAQERASDHNTAKPGTA